jgi:hypothetical protein
VPAVAALAAVGLAAAAWPRVQAAAMETLNKQIAANLKQDTTLTKGFADAETAGVKLTGAQKDYYAALLESAKAERIMMIAQMESRRESLKYQASMGTVGAHLKSLAGSLLNIPAWIKAQEISMARARLELKKLDAELEALLKGYNSVEDAVTSEGKAAEETLKMQRQYTQQVIDVTTQLGVNLMESARTGTITAKEAFKDFADTAIQEIERVLVKAVVMQAILPALGVPTNLLNFQYGGTVPGPQGAPRMVMAHGGERISTPNGRGGGGRGAGGQPMNIYVNGGIGGLDSRSLRMVVSQLRYAIRSTGEQGLG